MVRRTRRAVRLTEPAGQGFRVTAVTVLGPAPGTAERVRVRLANGQVRVVPRLWLR